MAKLDTHTSSKRLVLKEQDTEIAELTSLLELFKVFAESGL